MHRIVGLIYAIPVTLILLALVLRTQGFFTPKPSLAKQAISPTASQFSGTITYPTSTPKTQQPQNSFSFIDLQKEQQCTLPESMGNAQVEIGHGMAHATFQEKKLRRSVVYKSDCIYSWIEGQRTGEKTCGVGNIFTILQTVGSVTGSTFGEMIQPFLQSSGIQTSGIPIGDFDISRYCRPAVVEEKVFTIAPSVVFSEGKATKN